MLAPYLPIVLLFALATLYDPQPNAALEAMACGLPVVTTPGCGVAELITEGAASLDLAPFDPARLPTAPVYH